MPALVEWAERFCSGDAVKGVNPEIGEFLVRQDVFAPTKSSATQLIGSKVTVATESSNGTWTTFDDFMGFRLLACKIGGLSLVGFFGFSFDFMQNRPFVSNEINGDGEIQKYIQRPVGPEEQTSKSKHGGQAVTDFELLEAPLADLGGMAFDRPSS
ncbi:hypothetical protein U1Q18_029474 [Sarracenia purpurea var. burkii]